MYRNIKIRVAEANASATVQELLFTQGIRWVGSWINSTVVQHLDKPYLFIDEVWLLRYGTELMDFIDHEYTELKLEFVPTLVSVVRETVEVDGKTYYKDEVVVALSRCKPVE